MENITQTTTEKLETALTSLIAAYTDLQDENKQLNNRIEDLEDENQDLTTRINSLSSNSGKTDGAISGMLGKIESILSGNTSKSIQQIKLEESSIFANSKIESTVTTKEEEKIPNLDDILGIKLS